MPDKTPDNYDSQKHPLHLARRIDINPTSTSVLVTYRYISLIPDTSRSNDMRSGMIQLAHVTLAGKKEDSCSLSARSCQERWSYYATSNQTQTSFQELSFQLTFADAPRYTRNDPNL